MAGEEKLFDISKFFNQLRSIELIDVIDIILVAACFFIVYLFIRNRRAGKLIIGIVFLAIVLLVSNLAGLKTLSFILENCFQVGFVALVIVFQPELRSALEKMGAEPLKGLKNISEKGEGKKRPTSSAYIGEIAQACGRMSEEKTGALIVLERTTNLDAVVKGGTVINSDVTAFLIENIFYKGAPLHDGAMIIRDGRVAKAGCLLPLSSSDSVSKSLGTRHHAGVGVSEESDAVVIIVSEETGTISIAENGKLRRGFSAKSLGNELDRIFNPGSRRGVSKKKESAEV